ncbi:MAG: thioredoxin domain-containing protein [Pseudomonas sp.]|nr:thioredoxin domain-containing protein [Pseudomonas sp.]
MNRRAFVLGSTALGVIAFGGGALYINRQRQRDAAHAAATAPPITDDAVLIRPYSPIFGPIDAPATLVEFFDPSCEACRAYHPVLQQLRKEFPTQLRIVLRYTVFHEGSDEVVRMLEAARRQDLFEPVLDALLEEQPGWAVHGAPELDVAWEIAGAAGFDLDKAEGDLLFPGTTAVLNQDAADVETLNIRQTPTFFLNGKRLESFSADTLVADIRLAVEQAG